MSKFLSYFTLLLISVFLLSCQKDEDSSINGSGSQFTITATSGFSVKSVFEESPDGQMLGLYWSPQDQIGVFSQATVNAPFSSDIQTNSPKADFTGIITGYPQHAYFPYDKSNTQKNMVTSMLPLIQEYSSTDGILNCDFRVGRPINSEATQFRFEKPFSMFRFVLDPSNTAFSGDRLCELTVSFPQDVTIPNGSFTYSFETRKITWNTASSDAHSITLKWTDKPELQVGQKVYGYLEIPPLENLNGKDITISIKTDQRIAQFTTQLKVGALVANAIYSFPLTLSSWMDKLGPDFIISDPMAIESLSFTAQDNEKKILSRKLHYVPTAPVDSRTQYSDDPKMTTMQMQIGEHEITGMIPYLYNRSLKPTISFTKGAQLQLSTDKGQTFNNVDPTQPVDFTSGNILRVSKGDFHKDYTINIRNTGLPVVVIEQQGGDTSWPQVGISVWGKQSGWNKDAHISIYNPDGSVTNLANAPASLKLRGNSTQTFPKKPFAIKLESAAPVLGMPAHKRWILLANWKDRSLMRNHVALNLAQLFTQHMPDGIPWNVHGQFVEVVYNGVHIGNYYLCEQIKIDPNRLNIQDHYDDKTDPVIQESDLSRFGYLIEADDNYDEVDKFMTKHKIPFMLKDDGDKGGIIKTYLKDRLQSIESQLYSAYKTPAATEFSKAFQQMNLASFVDQLLIYEVTMMTEFVHPKSVYLYQNGTGKLAAGPVWDFDWQSFPTISSQLTQMQPGYNRQYGRSLLSDWPQGKCYWVRSPNQQESDRFDYAAMWYPMLVKSEEFNNLVIERWNRIKPFISQYAQTGIIAAGEKLAASWEVNNAIWPAYTDDGSERGHYCDGFCGDEKFATFKEVYEALKTSLEKRISGMDSFIPQKSWNASEITETWR